MNVKTLQKVLSVLVLVAMIVSMASTIVLASETSVVTPKDITRDDADPSITTGTIDKAGRNIVSILQAVGVVLSVVMLIVIGIKYMMGSAEEKAEYKKTLMPYVIGAALIFAASVFAQVAYDFFDGWNANAQ